MFIDNRTVTVDEASAMLGMNTDQVLKLAQHGLLGQATPIDGKTRITYHSIETYARRNGIKLQNIKKPVRRVYGDYTIQQTMDILGLKDERDLHRLIQKGSLKAGFVRGQYMVDANSVENTCYGVVTDDR
jgi:hypothetical protein